MEESFRKLSLWPTNNDLFNNNNQTVPINIIEGPYEDTEQYLNVHFRLLREDFIAPLRADIENYLLDKSNYCPNITVYSPVQFECKEIIRQHECVRLKTLPKQKFREQRFMHGALVCFTKDNFQTFIFAKVFNYEHHELTVQFEKPSSTVVIFNSDYIMIEYHVYFEPYFHVLKALKSITEHNFPMRNYLVDISTTAKPPNYINILTSITVNKCKFRVLGKWSKENSLELNASQQKAFKAALSQKFTIIQGPPGTGKTYVGLKIAETLIQNHQLWYNRSPILVVCYTNHALDQFLEGILKFTEKVIRVGGRSKNDALDKHNLKEKRLNYKDKQLSEKTCEMYGREDTLKQRKSHLLAVDRISDVIDFHCFASYIPNFQTSWFSKATDEDIVRWFTEPYVPNSLKNDHVYQDLMELKEELEEADETNEYQMEYFNWVLKYILHSYRFDNYRPVVVKRTILGFLKLPQKLTNKICQLEEQLKALLADEYLDSIESLLKAIDCLCDTLVVKQSYLCLIRKLKPSIMNADLEDLFTKLTLDDVTLKDPFSIKPADRWDLYWHWLKQYRNALRERLEAFQQSNRPDYEILEEMRRERDEKIMSNCLVVGMTTTGAARLRTSLEAITPAIVIIEEAAEVLESHIVASLTEHTQHLILLGDHKQLRPKTADYGMETKCQLGISLFERMVLNGVQCHTLNVQHRMRPEISKLITPAIYPVLEDHPSLATSRPEVNCVTKSLFFIDHREPEACNQGTSKLNLHEAGFLVNLARHLLLNGYKPGQITILAAYAAQKSVINEVISDQKLGKLMQDLRVTDVDDYQGEEADIILLSLVRNNKSNRIGFLATENRVCVALSRARCGLYIMGNMESLSMKSTLWQKVRETLEQQQALGTELSLRCQIHQENITKVKTDFDFLDNVPFGGCQLQCGATLKCGHFCKDPCHFIDRAHEAYECMEKCNKNNCPKDSTHLCKRLCCQTCDSCNIVVSRILDCGHEVEMSCSQNVEEYKCKALVAFTVGTCGHNIEFECSTNREELLCTFPVLINLECGHAVTKQCHLDPNTVKCPVKCGMKLNCGHVCDAPCHVFSNTLHSEVKCMKICDRVKWNCRHPEPLHICSKLCHEKCEKCMIYVKKIRSPCGHLCKIPCFYDVDRTKCRKKCGKKLICGHECTKKCFRHPQMFTEIPENEICASPSCEICDSN